MRKLKVFEAFSGYGSQSMALRNLGIDYEVVAISEIDKYAIKAYKAIHGDILNLGDISKINVNDIPEHNLFTYSFPCQDISMAGKQLSLEEGSGTRSSLLWECKKIIEHSKPKYLLMENVKNLISKKHLPYFNLWLEYLESLGYKNYWDVLNAKDFGVPQNRERVFVVSILNEEKTYNFPRKKKINYSFESILDKDRVINNTSENIIIDSSIKPCVKVNLEREKYDILNTDKEIYQCKCKSGWQDNKVGIKVSPTIRANNSHTAILYNNQIIKLSTSECFRLMGLNDDDILKIQSTNISKTQQYKLAGNSIVVNVLEEIFKELFL